MSNIFTSRLYIDIKHVTGEIQLVVTENELSRQEMISNAVVSPVS